MAAVTDTILEVQFVSMKKENIPRPLYMQQLIDFKDKDIIKVVTGIRRSGKSTLLEMFAEYLKEHGVKEEQIIFINFESAKFEYIRDGKELYEHIKNNISQNGRTYVFLDEIQAVKDFESSVNSITVDFDTDVYLTGSNAYMLSSDLSTLLSGRHVEIMMYPFSFKEYMSAQSSGRSPEDCLYDYMKYGGFPFLVNEKKEKNIGTYLDGIYNTVVFKDIIQRNRVKDPAFIEKLIRFIFSSMGCIVSPSSISKAMRNEGRSVTNETIDNYLEMLCKAYVLSKTVRYDIKGKEYLKTLNKYYVTDLGLRNHIMGYRQTEVTHALENIIYFELLRRGYKVDIGKIDSAEVEFIARNENEIKYYQVAWTVSGRPETLEREYRPFDMIPDHYEKALITMDKDPFDSLNGVKRINAIDFLLSDP